MINTKKTTFSYTTEIKTKDNGKIIKVASKKKKCLETENRPIRNDRSENTTKQSLLSGKEKPINLESYS